MTQTYGTMQAKAGDRCSNGAYETRWTCPGCYTDHHDRVTRCTECGAPLRCEIERQPIPVCTIADPDEEDEGDEG